MWCRPSSGIVVLLLKLIAYATISRGSVRNQVRRDGHVADESPASQRARAPRVARHAARALTDGQGARRRARRDARPGPDLVRGAHVPRRLPRRADADARSRRLGPALAQRPDPPHRSPRPRRPHRAQGLRERRPRGVRRPHRGRPRAVERRPPHAPRRRAPALRRAPQRRGARRARPHLGEGLPGHPPLVGVRAGPPRSGGRFRVPILDMSRLRFLYSQSVRTSSQEASDMALVRWEPVRELTTLQNEMNRLFSTFFDNPVGGAGNGNGQSLRRWVPAMDLVETADHFVLKADLPGLGPDDVNIEVEDSVLTVSGERKVEHEAQSEGFYRV